MDHNSVQEVIDRVAAKGTVTATLDGSEHQIFPVAPPLAEGEAIRELVIREGASHSIEIGLGYGISALFICDGLAAVGGDPSRHVVIDPNQESRFANIGVQLLDEARIRGMVDHYAQDSQVVLPMLLNIGESFDFAFIDGNHRFDYVFVDLFFLGRLLEPGSVVVLDDYQLPGIARAVSFFLTNRAWTLESVSQSDDLHNWAVVRTSPEKDGRSFTHFVDF